MEIGNRDEKTNLNRNCACVACGKEFDLSTEGGKKEKEREEIKLSDLHANREGGEVCEKATPDHPYHPKGIWREVLKVIMAYFY